MAGLVLIAFAARFAQLPFDSRWVVVAVGLGLVLRLLLPVYSWYTCRLLVDEHGITVVTGLVRHRSRSMSWDSIGTVELGSSWAQRFFGLTEVTLLQGAADATTLVIPAVDVSVRDSIERRSRTAGRLPDPRARPGPHGHRDEDPGSQMVYSASVWDLAVAGLMYGRFVGLGFGAVVGGVGTVLELGQADRLLALSGGSVLGLLVLAAVLVPVVGLLLTVLRYSSFTVLRTDGGHLVLSYGLLSTKRRVVGPDGIVGLTLSRNLLETAADRVRLTLVSVDSSSGLGTNLVLPSLPRRIVAEIADTVLGGERLRSPLYVAGWRRALVVKLSAASMLLATAVLAATTMGGLSLNTAQAVGGGILVAVLLGILVERAAARLTLDRTGSAMVLEVRVVSEFQRRIDLAAVQGVSEYGFIGRSICARVDYYGGGRRALTALRYDRRALDDLPAALLAAGRRSRRSSTVDELSWSSGAVPDNTRRGS